MPTADLLNSTAVPGMGHNRTEAPDYAKQVTERMADEYAEVIRALDALILEAEKQPEVVEDDAQALAVGAVVKRLKDLDARLESIRVVEKEPYLRSSNALDAFFNGYRDKIAKRDRNDRRAKPGHVDVLQARIGTYQDLKLARERARLKREAEERLRLAEEARLKAEHEQREAAEARLAAERARKPETVVAKAAVADAAAVKASDANVEAVVAAEKAEEAHIATLAKPADLTRVRGNDAAGAGVTLTTAREGYAIVTEANDLDKDKLWPFISLAEKEKAVRQWAKNTGHTQQMAGAEVGFRNKSVTR